MKFEENARDYLRCLGHSPRRGDFIYFHGEGTQTVYKREYRGVEILEKILPKEIVGKISDFLRRVYIVPADLDSDYESD